ncbi:hypothetical protein B0E37_06328 [Streptomyces sp. MH192]|uniref:hypothetical protein n=1 Tax=Streptomyces sp. MH192 TaxID=1945514 RepID=UPI001F450476|nr:hypothetical protein [Streptomyces sp. MH192]MCF0091207.1 hypothetical protein [Streptomyces sp. MH192]
MSGTLPAPGPLSWPELVTTALLGTDRRTPPGLPPGREAPAALLDAAAVAAVLVGVAGTGAQAAVVNPSTCCATPSPGTAAR